jgi:hypothetical protein
MVLVATITFLGVGNANSMVYIVPLEILTCSMPFSGVLMAAIKL